MAMNPTDIQIDIWPQSARQGGMQVGTIGSGVTALHIPSQLGITCNSERSQHANKEKALQLLEALLLAIESENQFSDTVVPTLGELRASQWAHSPPPTPYVAGTVMKIKEVREKSGFGLKECKDAIDKMGTVEAALMYLTGSTGYCSEGGACVCGGDLPAIREGCYNWKK